VRCPARGAPTRVFGSNLGVSPSIVFGDGYLIPSTQVLACSISVSASPYSCYEFTAPGGEGSGLQVEYGGAYAPYGYRIVLQAGNQDSQFALLRYHAPNITFITSTAGFPTMGGILLQLVGFNFGMTTSGRSQGYFRVTLVRRGEQQSPGMLQCSAHERYLRNLRPARGFWSAVDCCHASSRLVRKCTIHHELRPTVDLLSYYHQYEPCANSTCARIIFQCRFSPRTNVGGHHNPSNWCKLRNQRLDAPLRIPCVD
jgi:hypothetical protein